MDRIDMVYWRGEIGASIVGVYEKMGQNRGDEELEEELKAFNRICDLAENYLALKEGLEC